MNLRKSLGKSLSSTSSFATLMRQFLKEGDLIYYMIAVYTGTVLNDFLSKMSSSVIVPFFSMIFPFFVISDQRLSYLESLGFKDLHEVMASFLSLLISIIVSFFILRFVLNIDKSRNTSCSITNVCIFLQLTMMI